MAWIESHQELANHPKTKRLKRLLGVSLPEVIGLLHLLWWWALDYAPQGILTRFDMGDIADAMHWENDPEVLLSALVEAGFLDRTQEGIIIHDWWDYAGKLLAKREKDRQRKAEEAHRKKTIPQEFHGNGVGSVEDATGTPKDSSGTNSTEQNTTEPDRTEPYRTELDNELAGVPPPCPFDEIKNMFNETCISLPRIRGIEGQRKKAVAFCWEQLGRKIDTFRELFLEAEASDFLRGSNDRNWTATFDWLVRAENVDKVLEGRYRQKRDGFVPKTSKRGRSSTMEVLMGIMDDREGDPTDDENRNS